MERARKPTQARQHSGAHMHEWICVEDDENNSYAHTSEYHVFDIDETSGTEATKRKNKIKNEARAVSK